MALITSAALRQAFHPWINRIAMQLGAAYDRLGPREKMLFFAGTQPEWWKTVSNNDQAPEWYRLVLENATKGCREQELTRLGVLCCALLLIDELSFTLEEIENLGSDTESRSAELRGYLGFLFDVETKPVRCIKFVELVAKLDIKEIQSPLRSHRDRLNRAGPVTGNFPLERLYRALRRTLDELGIFLDLREPPPKLVHRCDTAALRQIGNRGRRRAPNCAPTVGGGK